MSDPSSPLPPPPYSTLPPPTPGSASIDTADGVVIGAVPAAAGVAIIWIVSGVTSVIALAVWSGITGEAFDSLSAWGTVVGLIGQWIAVVGGLVLISHLFGTGNLLTDYGIRFVPFRNGLPGFDVLGFFAGVGTQLILLPLLYWPLRSIWPDTFSNEQLEERARSLVSDSTGAGLVALFVCIALFAPLIEETMYRGLLQRSLQRPIHKAGAWVVASAVFAAVHLAPVEFPGLFVSGLVFGLGVLLTNRIGFGIAAHFGFNACAVAILVATR